MEHLSQTQCFWLLCFLRKCFLIPTRSPRAWRGSWWRQVGSGQTNTFFLTASAVSALLSSFHGTLWRRRCIWRFWSLWNPWLHISQTYRSDSKRVFGDKETTSASGSNATTQKWIQSLNFYEMGMDKNWKRLKLWIENGLNGLNLVKIYLGFLLVFSFFYWWPHGQNWVEEVENHQKKKL